MTTAPEGPAKRAGSRNIKIHEEFQQGSLDWLQARCGMITASEMKLIVTPTFQPAANDKERSHLFELLAQRISGYVEPHYLSDDMLRGQEDEVDARAAYEEHFAPVTTAGFIVNTRHGFKLGYSPDGLVGDHGLIECKSRRQKFQVQTIVENVFDDCRESIPADYVIQCQTALLVTERRWLDFISYSAGLPMVVIRVLPSPVIQRHILEAATAFEARLAKRLSAYRAALAGDDRLIPTERKIEQEII